MSSASGPVRFRETTSWAAINSTAPRLRGVPEGADLELAVAAPCTIRRMLAESKAKTSYSGTLSGTLQEEMGDQSAHRQPRLSLGRYERAVSPSACKLEASGRKPKQKILHFVAPQVPTVSPPPGPPTPLTSIFKMVKSGTGGS